MAGGKMSRESFDVENLENRRLFATVNIVNFGAVAGDGRDDSAAIKRAIAASATGDTVYFPEGTYDLGSFVTFNGGRNYLGVVGKSVLKRPGTDRAVQIPNYANDITIDGLVFDGNGVKIENSSGITIQNNIFQNMKGTYANNHILMIAGSITNSTITKNRFENIWGDNAIMAYNISYTSFTYNKFDNVHEGIHIINFNRYAKGVSVSFNCLTRVQRMGIEIQESDKHEYGGFDGLMVEGNRYMNPINLERETFAYSIVSDKAVNVVIRNNYASGPNSYPGLVYGFETAGIGTRIENNRVDSGWIGIIMQNTVNAIVTGNQIYATGRSIIPGVSAIASNVSGNTIGQNVPAGLAVPPCPADAPPSTGGGTTTPPTNPVPDPTPDPVPDPTPPVIETVPPLLSGVGVGADRISLTWTDTAKKENGYAVYRSTDAVNFTEVKGDLAADTKSYTDGSLKASTSYYYKVRFFYNDLAGGFLYGPWSNLIRVTTLAITPSGGGTTGGTTTGGTTTGGTTTGGGIGGTPTGGTTTGTNPTPIGSNGTPNTGGTTTGTTTGTGGGTTSIPSSGTVSTSSYTAAPKSTSTTLISVTPLREDLFSSQPILL